MIIQGSYAIVVSNDGWIIKIVNSNLALHVEDLVVISNAESKIIMRPEI